MKRNVNAVVVVDVGNLRRPTTTFQARLLCAFSAEFVNVPDDIVQLAVVVYTPNGEHYVPFPACQNGNGEWLVHIPPTHFPTAGEAKYEIIGVDGSDFNTCLGVGKLLVDPFGSGATPIPEVEVIPVVEIPDQYGRAHKIKAVNTGTAEDPNWTSIVEV